VTVTFDLSVRKCSDKSTQYELRFYGLSFWIYQSINQSYFICQSKDSCTGIYKQKYGRLPEKLYIELINPL